MGLRPAESGAAFSTGTALDAIYDYTESKGIIFKQHAFSFGARSSPAARPTRSTVEAWIQAFCERYPGATRYIDVVNEPPPHFTTPGYVDAPRWRH